MSPNLLKGRFHCEAPAKHSLLLVQQRACLVLWLVGTAFASGPAIGQTSSGTTLYRLKTDSSYERGCFAPCMCPVMITEPVVGTFFLTPTVFDGLFYYYAVTGVHWTFTNSDTATTVTGSGTYKVGVGGTGARQQELLLDLQMNGGAIEHFDSGLVADSVPLPNIQVSISTNRMYCFDSVFVVDAAPAPMPRLNIGVSRTNTVVLSWAVCSAPFSLQKSSDPSGANWVDITNAPTVVGQQNQLVLPLSSGGEYYRLEPGS